MSIVIEQGDPRDPQATALLEQSYALMVSLFPAESNHYLSIDALCAPEITFFVAREGETILGTAALAEKGDYLELKSMFTDPDARGKGIADKMMDHLISHARDRRATRIYLETGDLLHAAHKLYRKHGFTTRGPFGDYAEDPNSLFMEKSL